MKRIFVDETVCTGCRYCEIACSLFHEGAINPRKSRIRIISNIQKGSDKPLICRQCAKPPCAEACPVEAIKKNSKLNIPIVDESKCIGCMECLKACPFNAIIYDQCRGTVLKCDLCGGDPQCVKFCRALPHIGYSAITYTTPHKRTQKKVKKMV